jgi:hypothetical protein
MLKPKTPTEILDWHPSYQWAGIADPQKLVWSLSHSLSFWETAMPMVSKCVCVGICRGTGKYLEILEISQLQVLVSSVSRIVGSNLLLTSVFVGSLVLCKALHKPV